MNKIFTHKPISLPDIETEHINGRRYYVTPKGKYPSITTLLGQDKDKEEILDRWRKRIGLDAANNITEYACDLGENLHSTIEKYLNNDSNYRDNMFVQTKYMFNSLRPHLDNIDNILCQEVALYSDVLKLAGRTDCIGEYNNKLSIIDFKTSRREKTEEDIQHYFIQGTAYSLMLEEMTGIVAPNIVIIMSQYDAKPLIFEVDRKNYYSGLKKYIDNYLGGLLLGV